MNGPRYISVSDWRPNPYRTWETRENSANWYGLVLAHHEGGDPDYIPVICGHGGSMWLCAGCAQRLMASNPASRHEPDQTVFVPQTDVGATLRADSNQESRPHGS